MFKCISLSSWFLGIESHSEDICYDFPAKSGVATARRGTSTGRQAVLPGIELKERERTTFASCWLLTTKPAQQEGLTNGLGSPAGCMV